jgi:hypothetical protein
MARARKLSAVWSSAVLRLKPPVKGNPANDPLDYVIRSEPDPVKIDTVIMTNYAIAGLVVHIVAIGALSLHASIAILHAPTGDAQHHRTIREISPSDTEIVHAFSSSDAEIVRNVRKFQNQRG